MTRAPSAKAIAIERARRLRFCSSVRTILPGSRSMSSPPPRRPITCKVTCEACLEQQHGKNDEEIQDRERKQPPCRVIGSLAFPLLAQPPGERDHHRACQERRHAIDRLSIAEKPRCRTHKRERYGIEQNLPPGFMRARNHWQHRHSGTRIVVDAGERQRPEVRRRPEEHDEKQQARLDGNPPCRCPPPNHWRKAAPGPAVANVL